MLRYFIGVELPTPLASVLQDFMIGLGDRCPLPHITLKAPGGLTPDLRWLATVEDLVARTPRLSVTVGDPNVFGDRILYLAVHSMGLRRLRDELHQALPALGVEFVEADEGAVFVPHVTLGRFASGAVEPLARARASAEAFSSMESFEVGEIVVFRRDDREPYSAWSRLPMAATPVA